MPNEVAKGLYKNHLVVGIQSDRDLREIYGKLQILAVHS